MRRKANDPLILRGRKRRIRPLVASLLIGAAVASLSYRDTQVAIGQQDRETILTTQYYENGKQVGRSDEVLSVTVFLTASSGTWATPAGVISARVDCIGGGAGGFSADGSTTTPCGSGGGAWARGAAVPVADNMNYAVGAGGARPAVSANIANSGNPTWFGGTAYANSLVGAPGGTGSNGVSGGAGGAAASCRGGAVGGVANPGATYSRSGGAGGLGSGISGPAGSGGAAGPNGNGNGGAAYTSGFGSVGGAGDAGFGGGGGGPGGGGAATTGGNGAEYDATHGSGGGAGGTSSPTPNTNGGFYGGAGGVDIGGFGGGPGAQGLIVVVYTLPTAPAPFRRTMRFFTRRA